MDPPPEQIAKMMREVRGTMERESRLPPGPPLPVNPPTIQRFMAEVREEFEQFHERFSKSGNPEKSTKFAFIGVDMHVCTSPLTELKKSKRHFYPPQTCTKNLHGTIVYLSEMLVRKVHKVRGYQAYVGWGVTRLGCPGPLSTSQSDYATQYVHLNSSFGLRFNVAFI
jgi:hypothetical protein